MNPSSKHTRLVLRCVAGAALSTALSCALALKVDMYAIGNWSGGNCAPGDTGADRGSWPGMASAWYDWMGLMGHAKTGKFVDGNTTVKRFCDPSVNAGCQDFSYVDWPDAAIVAAHGWDAGNGWGALMRNSALGTCGAVMGTASGNMFVGDGSLKFLHASSCLSLNDNYFSNMRMAMKETGSSKGLHVMTGFHGVMWISSSFNGDYAATAINGHVQSVAKAWTGAHYKSNKFSCAPYDPFNWFGTCQDQCPTAMTIGATPGNALNRLLNERYNNSGSFGPPNGRSYYAWMGYPGCNPVAENAFNP
ncbi:MAG: hypothetical protein A3E25_23010 [Burkholderiales bacterium RIFCSPHIGHO2_12_FULL_69_20]|nr:MAG: hypothetical protein A3E25_23010 [Burkholderiales bacterium RIFCSPHIGHO2_12_FULL_69_20]